MITNCCSHLGRHFANRAPKASVSNANGTLLIVKFPKRDEDDYGIVAWEAVALLLARLSPLFYVNPVPTDIKDRVFPTAIGLDDDPTASIEIAFEVAPMFALKALVARDVASEVGAAVAKWRIVGATRLGLSAAEIERMHDAFDHHDLQIALSAA